MCKPELLTTDTGFAIITTKGTDTVSLSNVSSIVAYKVDEITTDLICCDITTIVDGLEEIRTIHEEIAGFQTVIAQFEALPGFNKQSRDTIVHQPFAAKSTTLYRRDECGI